jgi:hypothetical protein
MRNVFGMHAANKEPFCDDLLVSLGCGWTTIVIDGERARERVAWLRSRRPATELAIVLRPFFVSDMSTPPEPQAERCFAQVEPLLQHTTHVTLGNEFNVETPGFRQAEPADWHRLAEYKLRLYRRFRELAPRCDLHLSAESWGCGDDESALAPPGPALALQRPVAELCDYVDCHCYWPAGMQMQDRGGMRFLRVRQIFPDTPMVLTEAGPLDVRDQERAASEVVEWMRALRRFPWLCGFALFMVNWGPEHAELNYYDKPTLLARLGAADKSAPLVRIPLGPVVTRMHEWIVTREFGFRDPQYDGSWHKGTDLAHPDPAATHGARLFAPWPETAPDVTAWRSDRGWYGYWRWKRTGSDGVSVVQVDSQIALFACHLTTEPRDVGPHLGHVGNTGALTTGPHVHLGLCEEEPLPPYAVRRWIDIMGPEVERGW